MVRLGSTPVLDIGTFSAKVGFAGETYPVLLVTHEQFYPWPVQRGRITDWNALEELLRELWSKLRVESKEEEVIIVEPSGTPLSDRDNLEKLLFETFEVRYLTFLSSALCTVNSAGLKSGIVVDIGYGLTRISTVIDGVERKLITTEVCGQDVDECLKGRLSELYPQLDLSKHTREIKEKCCFVSLDPEAETTRAAEQKRYLQKDYTLATGAVVTLSRDRAYPMETIFMDASSSRQSIPNLIKDSIEAFPDKTELGCNIVLSGGTTVCHNFQYRLLSHLFKLKAAKVLRIFCPPERMSTCWSGASVVYFDNEYVDKGTSYNEYCTKVKSR